MQHLTISLDGIDGARLLHDWQWLLSGSHRLLAVTRMGDAFVENADGEVIFLDTLEGALKHAATNQNAFFKLLKAGELDPTWFNPNMVALLEARDHLASGQCYSYRIPPVLGGSLDSANVKAVSATVHFSVMGQLHEQIRHLPPGTKVSHFKIVE
jgi:Domain of unknown function (DUF1851)